MNAVSTGYLLKNSGGKKKDGAIVPQRRNSLGNMRSKWERRYFVLDRSGVLSYYKKASNVNEGKPPSGEMQLAGGFVAVEGNSGAFFQFAVETKDRVLSLRAETEVERSGWVAALLGVGVSDHPMSSNLAAHVPTPSSASPSAIAVARRAGKREDGPQGKRRARGSRARSEPRAD